MDMGLAGFAGALGVFAFFGGLALLQWASNKGESEKRKLAHELDLQKRQMEHTERLKALEAGFPPPEAEIERARAYASAARSAGLIGLVVPIVLVSLAVAGTIVAVLRHSPEESIGGPLIAAWSITGVIVLVTILRRLSVIRQLPRPTTDSPAVRPPVRDKAADVSAGEFQAKRLEL
jgi:hypothetical protein